MDGTLTWDCGGGVWRPGGGGGRGGGGGGGGDGGDEASDGGAGRSYSPLYAFASAFFLLLAKSLVCWCSEDPKAAATNIDLGFLTAMALLAWASLSASPLGALRLLLVQLTVAHIILEMAFYGVLLNVIDPAAGYKMAPAMWLHHIAVALGGAHTLLVTAPLGGGVFFWVGAQLIITEITTCLPVAFHQALKNRRMTGPRSVVLGTLMPAAFLLRCVLSFRVLHNYLAVTAALGGGAAVPFFWISSGCAATIFGLNLYWSSKIISGGLAAVRKKRARAAGGDATVFSHAAEAAVYTELTQQKERVPRQPRARAAA